MINIYRHHHTKAKWVPTDVKEMYLFLATFMLMAHMKKFKIKDDWSTHPLIAAPVFGDIMPRDRFLLLLKFLQFNPLYPVGSFLTHSLKCRFHALKKLDWNDFWIPFRTLNKLYINKKNLTFLIVFWLSYRRQKMMVFQKSEKDRFLPIFCYSYPHVIIIPTEKKNF